MNIKTYRRGEVIFRQGDPGDSLYDIQSGRVEIIFDRGGPREQKLADLYTNQVFGELGLIDHAPRSATAVAMEDDTIVDVITEDTFLEFFEKNPAKMLVILQQMCSRLRRTSREYAEACHTIREADTAERAKEAVQKSGFQRFADMYKRMFSRE